MSKIYKNKKTSVVVASGLIKSISDDRTVLTMTVNSYNSQTKTNESKDYDVVSKSVPYDDTYKIGKRVTAVGYNDDNNIINNTTAVLVGNDTFEMRGLSIITGLVKYARLNEEKNADGTPKMKQDGVTPRKPHFDVSVSVKDNDSQKWVSHIIKIYDMPGADGKKSQFEIAKQMFSKFNPDENRMAVTFVTKPGTERSWSVTKNGKEYTNFAVDHIGYLSMDAEYIEQKERTNSQPVAQNTNQTPVQNTAPVQNVAPAPTEPIHQEAASEVNGLDADFSVDEEEVFR